MPSGIELVLGFHFSRFKDVENELGIKIKLFDSDDFEDIQPEHRRKEINNLLTEAHKSAILRMGFEIKGVSDDNYLLVKTPLGEREMSRFEIEFFCDNEEIGEKPEDAVIGVSISSRYFPTFADWKNVHGTLSPIIFDDELSNMMEIAKEEISKRLPVFEKAVWAVKEKWY